MAFPASARQIIPPAGSFGLIDVTLRDGHQCLWSTRMTNAQMAPILGTIDRSGYAIVNIMGGAVFDVAVRFLREDPWERMKMICARMQTPCDALTRGQSLYTFELFPDDIVALNSQVLAQCGIRILTVYDALNDNRNIESSVTSGREAGMLINAMITYALSPVHTDAYFVARARELVAMKVDFISLKDPTGLLTPERGRTLFPALVQAAAGIPLKLHSHCQSGLAPEVYRVAMESGFRFAYTAVRPLANGASLPASEDIDDHARALGLATGIDRNTLAEASDYFRWVALRDDKPVGKPARLDPALYQHQVPGGMISNLRSQLAAMGIEHRMPEILEEAAQVREDLGYPILVSPFAQYIITQAVLNVVQGERYKTIPDEVRKYARGLYGRLAARPSDDFLNRAHLDPGDASQRRPAEHLEDGIPALRRRLGSTVSDAQLLLHAFYDDSLAVGLKAPDPDLRFHTTPLSELIRYLGNRRDIGRARLRFAGVELSFSS
jgi:pyruvate/oxaloacetate carboxyltransferase